MKATLRPGFLTGATGRDGTLFQEAGSENFFDSAHDSVLQAYLDAMRMGSGFCQDSLNNTFGEPPGALILFLHDLHK